MSCETPRLLMLWSMCLKLQKAIGFETYSSICQQDPCSEKYNETVIVKNRPKQRKTNWLTISYWHFFFNHRILARNFPPNFISILDLKPLFYFCRFWGILPNKNSSNIRTHNLKVQIYALLIISGIVCLSREYSRPSVTRPETKVLHLLNVQNGTGHQMGAQCHFTPKMFYNIDITDISDSATNKKVNLRLWKHDVRTYLFDHMPRFCSLPTNRPAADSLASSGLVFKSPVEENLKSFPFNTTSAVNLPKEMQRVRSQYTCWRQY